MYLMQLPRDLKMSDFYCSGLTLPAARGSLMNDVFARIYLIYKELIGSIKYMAG